MQAKNVFRYTRVLQYIQFIATEQHEKHDVIKAINNLLAFSIKQASKHESEERSFIVVVLCNTHPRLEDDMQ